MRPGIEIRDGDEEEPVRDEYPPHLGQQGRTRGMCSSAWFTVTQSNDAAANPASASGYRA
jgi:hypothetical protein